MINTLLKSFSSFQGIKSVDSSPRDAHATCAGPRDRFSPLPKELRQEVYQYLSDRDLASVFSASGSLCYGDLQSELGKRLTAKEFELLPENGGAALALLVPSKHPHHDTFSFRKTIEWDRAQLKEYLDWPGSVPGRQASGIHWVVPKNGRNWFSAVDFTPDGQALIGTRFSHYDHSFFDKRYQPGLLCFNPEYGLMLLDEMTSDWNAFGNPNPSLGFERTGADNWRPLTASASFCRHKATGATKAFNSMLRSAAGDFSRGLQIETVRPKAYKRFSSLTFFADGQHFLVQCLDVSRTLAPSSTWALFDTQRTAAIGVSTVALMLKPESARFSDDGNCVMLAGSYPSSHASHVSWFFWDRRRPEDGLELVKQVSAWQERYFGLGIEGPEASARAAEAAVRPFLFASEQANAVFSAKRNYACVYGLKSRRLFAVNLLASPPKVHHVLDLWAPGASTHGEHCGDAVRLPRIRFSCDGANVGIVARTSKNGETSLTASAYDDFSVVRLICSTRPHLSNQVFELIPSPDGVRNLLVLDDGEYEPAVSLLIDRRQSTPWFK